MTTQVPESVIQLCLDTSAGRVWWTASGLWLVDNDERQRIPRSTVAVAERRKLLHVLNFRLGDDPGWARVVLTADGEDVVDDHIALVRLAAGEA